MSIYIEDHLPVVKYNGLNTAKAANIDGVTVDTSGNTAIPGTLAVTGAITATGGVTGTLTGAVAGTTVSASGVITAKSAATVPASAGAVAAGIPITLFSDGPSIYVTSDAPAFSAVKGSLCINTAGSSSSTRLYVNNGTTNWVAVTTAT